MRQPVYRFAPSPSGLLHLGHAYSALVNSRLASRSGGRLLLRIEDIDLERADPAYEAAIHADLAWLGIRFEPEVRRQSEHLDLYRQALERLRGAGLVYPGFMSRSEIIRHVGEREAQGEKWPRDPDGAPHYPGIDRQLGEDERRARIEAGMPYNWRLDIRAACRVVGKQLTWREEGAGPAGETGTIVADPLVWGDVILARRDCPTSYHLAVVIDDALQGVTHVVRGQDLFHATAIHRLLQELLGLPAPVYHHHRLIVDASGRKLSKRCDDKSLAAMRAEGLTPADIMRLVGM